MFSPDVFVVVVRQGDGMWYAEAGGISHRSKEVLGALFISCSHARSGGDIGPRQKIELLYSSARVA